VARLQAAAVDPPRPVNLVQRALLAQRAAADQADPALPGEGGDLS
jgi:hypothetical protein